MVLLALLQCEGGLVDLNRELAARSRQGGFDGSEEAWSLLLASTVQRVRESAPKALSASNWAKEPRHLPLPLRAR
ncbi:hypothetical protein ASNO1_52120 [Corallococcus caeni]|uniref:Uncharacterized protein n=1 Tax=Corallococcus caeni TaxID=3082388 RepID=A0ABQ6QY32_9BACT|nr:hypothetical protein ASNO1_52120 [Corallococcus sp. NO1]